MLKHIGKYGEKPCIVIMRELPQERERCLIVEPNSLASRQHDELMSAVQSAEVQSSHNLAEALARKVFSNGVYMINELHDTGKIQKVPVSQVSLEPRPGQAIALESVNAELRKMESAYTPPNTDESFLRKQNQQVREAGEATKTTAQNVQMPVDGEPTEVARNLLTQAELLRADIKSMQGDLDRKLEEAYALDPSLKPEKRGRGRPRKDSA
jgi:hypothetical protein